MSEGEGKHFIASEIKHLFKASDSMCQKILTKTDKFGYKRKSFFEIF